MTNKTIAEQYKLLTKGVQKYIFGYEHTGLQEMAQLARDPLYMVNQSFHNGDGFVFVCEKKDPDGLKMLKLLDTIADYKYIDESFTLFKNSNFPCEGYQLQKNLTLTPKLYSIKMALNDIKILIETLISTEKKESIEYKFKEEYFINNAIDLSGFSPMWFTLPPNMPAPMSAPMPAPMPIPVPLPITEIKQEIKIVPSEVDKLIAERISDYPLFQKTDEYFIELSKSLAYYIIKADTVAMKKETLLLGTKLFNGKYIVIESTVLDGSASIVKLEELSTGNIFLIKMYSTPYVVNYDYEGLKLLYDLYNPSVPNPLRICQVVYENRVITNGLMMECAKGITIRTLLKHFKRSYDENKISIDSLENIIDNIIAGIYEIYKKIYPKAPGIHISDRNIGNFVIDIDLATYKINDIKIIDVGGSSTTGNTINMCMVTYYTENVEKLNKYLAIANKPIRCDTQIMLEYKNTTMNYIFDSNMGTMISNLLSESSSMGMPLPNIENKYINFLYVKLSPAMDNNTREKNIDKIIQLLETL